MSKRKRICLVTVEFHGLFKNGGIGTANTALALALAAEGFDVTVAIANADESGPRLAMGNFSDLKSYYAARGITLDYVPAHPQIAGSFDDPRTASYCVYLYLRACDFDAVLFNDNGGQGYYTLLASHTGVFENPPQLIVVAHGPVDWVHELNAQEYGGRKVIAVTWLEQRSALLCEQLVSPSRYLLDWMIARGWVPPEHGQVIQNLLDVPATAVYDASRGLKPVNEIVFFGRQETRKGMALFCDALDLLDRTTDLSTVRVTFLGKFSRIGAAHTGVYIAERAKRWRAAPRIIAVFDQKEALDYLRRPGVLAVIPSRAENSPCVVAECLLLGILFLASNRGGTPELIAQSDQESCLFTPEPAALAQRLGEVLRSGHRPAQMAIPQNETLAQWVALLTTPRPNVNSVTSVPPVRVSACLAWSASPHFATCLRALTEQAGPELEIIVGVEETFAADLSRIAGAEVISVFGRFGSRGAARNAAARRAKGDYLLFVDEEYATLQAGAIDTFAAAAFRTGVDILTCFREIAPGTNMPRPEQRSWELPVGAFTELGSIENCFGEGAYMVKASRFANLPGFASNGETAVLDWLFLAGAVLAGATLEVVPAPLIHLRESTATFDGGENTVEDRRDILRLYAGAPFATVERLFETTLRINEKAKQTMQLALQDASKPARELATRLAALEPNNAEARQLFVKYCCERRQVELAIDFSLYNDVSLLPETLTTLRQNATGQALRAIDTRQLDVRHLTELTATLQPRRRAFYGLTQRDLVALPAGAMAHRVPVPNCIVKFAGACPPGTGALHVRASCEGDATVQLSAVLCGPWARPLLSHGGIVPNSDVWWSGWTDAKPGSPCDLTIRLPKVNAELLDLYLLSQCEDPQAGVPRVIWEKISVELCLNGDITPSAIELTSSPRLLSLEEIARGEVLTDVSDINFPIFVPGAKTLLHPLTDRLALVRIPGALPPHAEGLRCIVSVGHADAHPIEFGVWVRPASQRAKDAGDLSEAENFSGWIAIKKPLTDQVFNLRLAHTSPEPLDIYLATRVVNAPNVYFCHAFWHEIWVMESNNPEALPAPAVATGNVMQRAYMLCAAPRTGSNLLATALRHAGAGEPVEYFNAASMNQDTMLQRLGLAAGTVGTPEFGPRLDQIIRAGTTPNGLFGMTVHWWDLKYLLAAVEYKLQRKIPEKAILPDGLPAVFPGLRYVWITRENKVARAISHYLAIQTGTWQVIGNGKNNQQPPKKEPVFDFEAIQTLVRATEAEDEGWRNFLDGAGVLTMQVTYETLDADFRGTVARVLDFLGIKMLPEEVPVPKLQRQADARSAAWEKRYREEELARQSAEETPSRRRVVRDQQKDTPTKPAHTHG